MATERHNSPAGDGDELPMQDQLLPVAAGQTAAQDPNVATISLQDTSPQLGNHPVPLSMQSAPLQQGLAAAVAPLALHDYRGILPVFSAWGPLYKPLTERLLAILHEYDEQQPEEAGGYLDTVKAKIQELSKNNDIDSKPWDSHFILEALRLMLPILHEVRSVDVARRGINVADLDASVSAALYLRHSMFHNSGPIPRETASHCLNHMRRIVNVLLPNGEIFRSLDALMPGEVVRLPCRTVAAFCMDGLVSLLVRKASQVWEKLTEEDRDSIIQAATSKKTRFTDSERNDLLSPTNGIELAMVTKVLSPESARSKLREILSTVNDAKHLDKAFQAINWKELEKMRHFVTHAHMSATRERWREVVGTQQKWENKFVIKAAELFQLEEEACSLLKALQIALSIVNDQDRDMGMIACKWIPNQDLPAHSHSLIFRPRISPPLVGRDSEIERALAATKEGTPVLITGSSGMGKTALAMTVVQRMIESSPSPGQLLLYGSSVLNAKRELVGLGRSADMSEDEALADARLRLAGWVVLVDNLDDCAVLDLLPLDTIQLIVTAQSAESFGRRLPSAQSPGDGGDGGSDSSGIVHIRLVELGPDEALALLRKCTGKGKTNSKLGDRFAGKDAKEFVESLGCLPAAIKVAGSLLKNQPDMPVSDVHEKWQELVPRGVVAGHADLDYMHSMAALFELGFQRLKVKMLNNGDKSLHFDCLITLISASQWGTPYLDNVQLSSLIGALSSSVYDPDRLKDIVATLYSVGLWGRELQSVPHSLMLTAARKLSLGDLSFKDAESGVWTCNAILRPLCKYGSSQSLKGAQEWFALMQEAGIVVNEITFNMLIDASAKLGDEQHPFEPEQWLQHMRDAGVTADVVTYNTIIRGVWQWHDQEAALRWVKQMESADVAFDLVTYNTVITMFARSKNNAFINAVKYLDQMQMQGIAADVVSFNSAIHSCVMQGQISEAEGLLQKMKAANVSPDVKTFTTLLNVCVAANDHKKAEELWELMLKEQVKPNKQAFCTKLNLHAKSAGGSSSAEAELFFADMEQANIIPDRTAYCTMIDVCAVRCEYSKAYQWFQRMLHSLKSADIVSCSTMLKALAKANRHQDAEDFFRQMKDEWDVTPNQYTYGSMIKMYAEQRMDEKAIGWFENMQSNVPGGANHVAYSAIIQMYCCKKKEHPIAKWEKEAMYWFQRMREKNITPEVYAYNSLLQMFVSLKKVEQVQELYQNMLDDNITPAGYFVTNVLVDMFDLLANKLSPEAALALLPKMFGYLEKKYTNCDQKRLDIEKLIKCYCKQGWFQEAIDLLPQFVKFWQATDSENAVWRRIIDNAEKRVCRYWKDYKCRKGDTACTFLHVGPRRDPPPEPHGRFGCWHPPPERRLDNPGKDDWERRRKAYTPP